ncbi:L-histidine N(alpha)-methyltransferase [Variovorax sp. HJSM1_2]|uniref:L-histidine N(alpha)-methyltransferase n=1 Tax=Variovorax sp. HJSM1_2 TaxID=3366263 RepID=UPI003BDE972D
MRLFSTQRHNADPAPVAVATAAARPESEFAHDLLAGLAAQPRSISPKYFYDARGSALFDQICELPEYYPTRTELQILQTHASEIAACIGPRAELVEFGAGSLRKVRLLLDAMDRPARYLPIDISGEHLLQSVARLQQAYSGLDVFPVVADYTRDLILPHTSVGAGRRVGFFPGSTIGNFSPAQALHFLRLAGRVLRGGALLLGADLVKEPALLHAAYNDAQGVTAAFNLNVLARANRELGADFDLSAFAHSAFYNAPEQRIEMHLMSRRSQRIRVCGQTFDFAEGDSLHTENSHKFTIDSLRHLAVAAGFSPGPVWTDANHLFSLHWLQAPT